MDEFDFEYADELEAMEDVDRKFFHLYQLFQRVHHFKN